jgi:LacI family transcriptional regulator, galactose operon repressor
VIGYDDDHFASESNIPISTVSQPGRRMGELAIELLIGEIRQPFSHIHRTETLDPHVIPRRSTLHSREDTSRSKGTHVAHMVGTAYFP